MAVDKKISQLASGAPAQAGDEYVVARSGANYKLTLTNIAASMPPIGATTPNTGAFTTLTATTGNITTVNATTVDATNVEVTNVKAKDGTAAITIADSTGNVGLSANLTFSSTGQRITGDMSNATLSNRLAFQTSTTNGNTTLNIIPNGTGTASQFVAHLGSDPANTSRAGININSSQSAALVFSDITGTGSYLPLTFYTGGSERMRLDTSGNLGIGTASPSYLLHTLGNTNGTISAAVQNSSNGASAYAFLRVGNDTSADAGLLRNSSGNSGYGGTNSLNVYQLGAYPIGFVTNNNLRMLIDSSGNVGIGGTASAFAKLNITGTLASSGANSLPMYINGTIPSTTTSQAQIFRSDVTTQAASFTLSALSHFRAGVGSGFGAGSTVSNQYGFFAESSLTGATSNYGFYSDIASGSNRWNFYAAGTAQNYFAGLTTIGTTNGDPVGNNVAGGALFADGRIQASVSSGASVFVNRKTDDGTLVAFYQDGTQEGTISVSGNTVSYNAFAGSHWSQLQDNSKPDILRGTVMESINELCVWPDENNERLPKSKVSDTAASKKVYGVFMAWDNDWTATNDMLVTSVGAFICRVNSSVTVQEGDLLESNGDGTARVQADDIIRSSTIGKVTSTVKTHQYADGSYCVPTVLYCG